MKIRVILPPWTEGGLKTVVEHVVKGLSTEGCAIEVIQIKELKLAKVFLKDAEAAYRCRCSDKLDAVLYFGSIPLPGHVIYRCSSVPSFLFIHGYTRHQLITTLKSSRSLRARVGTIPLLLELDFSRIFKTVNFYIAHSWTVHEMCRIPISRRIVLPQFMFYEEIEELHKFGNKIRDENVDFNKDIKILAYTSHTSSPRLLSTYDLIALGRLCSRRARRKIKLLIIDPNLKPLETSIIKIVRFLPKNEFLKELATSALYIERSIDDEIGYGSLEALALGTPVAKIVHPRYMSRIDYSEKELLIANSFKEFVEKLINYMNNLDDLYFAYSSMGFNFIKTKRIWDNVKIGLIKYLMRVHDGKIV